MKITDLSGLHNDHLPFKWSGYSAKMINGDSDSKYLDHISSLFI